MSALNALRRLHRAYAAECGITRGQAMRELALASALVSGLAVLATLLIVAAGS